MTNLVIIRNHHESKDTHVFNFGGKTFFSNGCQLTLVDKIEEVIEVNSVSRDAVDDVYAAQRYLNGEELTVDELIRLEFINEHRINYITSQVECKDLLRRYSLVNGFQNTQIINKDVLEFFRDEEFIKEGFVNNDPQLHFFTSLKFIIEYCNSKRAVKKLKPKTVRLIIKLTDNFLDRMLVEGKYEFDDKINISLHFLLWALGEYYPELTRTVVRKVVKFHIDNETMDKVYYNDFIEVVDEEIVRALASNKTLANYVDIYCDAYIKHFKDLNTVSSVSGFFSSGKAVFRGIPSYIYRSIGFMDLVFYSIRDSVEPDNQLAIKVYLMYYYIYRVYLGGELLNSVASEIDKELKSSPKEVMDTLSGFVLNRDMQGSEILKRLSQESLLYLVNNCNVNVFRILEHFKHETFKSLDLRIVAKALVNNAADIKSIHTLLMKNLNIESMYEIGAHIEDRCELASYLYRIFNHGDIENISYMMVMCTGKMASALSLTLSKMMSDDCSDLHIKKVECLINYIIIQDIRLSYNHSYDVCIDEVYYNLMKEKDFKFINFYKINKGRSMVFKELRNQKFSETRTRDQFSLRVLL